MLSVAVAVYLYSPWTSQDLPKPPTPTAVNATEILLRAVQVSKSMLAGKPNIGVLPQIDGLNYLNNLAEIGAEPIFETVFLIIAPKGIGKSSIYTAIVVERWWNQ